jgi:hypothetical protein
MPRFETRGGQPLGEELPPETGGMPEEMPAEEMPPEDQVAPDEGVPVDNGELPAVAEDASPEEQQQKDHFVGKAMELIYSDGMFDRVVKMLEGGAGPDAEEGNPDQGLATATNLIVGRVAQKAEEAGEPLAPDVLYHGAADIFEELAEVSRRGKIKDYSQDHDALERAWFMALDMYREHMQASGTLNQEDAKAGLSQLQAADQNGSLERIMRSLATNEHAGQAGGPDIPPEPANQNRKPKGLGVAMGAM